MIDRLEFESQAEAEAVLESLARANLAFPFPVVATPTVSPEDGDPGFPDFEMVVNPEGRLVWLSDEGMSALALKEGATELTLEALFSPPVDLNSTQADCRLQSRAVHLTIEEMNFEGCLRYLLKVSDKERRVQQELHLQRIETRFTNLVRQIPAVTFMGSLEESSSELFVSPQIEEMLGFTQEEWIGDPVLWYRQLHPDDLGLLNEEFIRGVQEGEGNFCVDCRFFSRDRRIVYIHAQARTVRDENGHPVSIQGVAFDITDIKKAEETVRESLREKEVLLKEIHHRVKNNMQVISSLLRLQAGRLEKGDPAAEVLEDSRQRIQAMALVHEKLYRSDHEHHRVDFAAYIRSLADKFRFMSSAREVRIQLELDRAEFGVDTAVPCGLLLSELLTNAAKHAFVERDDGTIEIRLERREGDIWELTVADDGCGLPEDFDERQTLGLVLVRELARQLGGELSMKSDGGARFTVLFPQER